MEARELDDRLVAHLPRSLQKQAANDVLPAFDPDAVLPAAGDPYKAAAMASSHSLTRLCCVMGREGFRSGGKAYRFFQYAQLDSDAELGYTEHGQRFSLRFLSPLPKLIVVEGRNLLRICDYIQWHRMPWIRIADRDFGDQGLPPGEPVITAIRITDWMPPGEPET